MDGRGVDGVTPFVDAAPATPLHDDEGPAAAAMGTVATAAVGGSDRAT